MKTASFIALLLAVLPALLAEEPSLDPNLEPLRPFLGSWRGEFKNSTPEKPIVDTSLWERALNGKAIRIVHSINDGAYGGETLVTWDAEKKSIVYHYFSTAGFRTEGTMKAAGKKLECHEVVIGSIGAATEVKSTFELSDDKTFRTESTYLKDGKPQGTREVTYKRADGAKPVFK